MNMTETCPTCGRDVDSIDLTGFGHPIRTAYWHPGVDGFASVYCNMPKLGPVTVYGYATVAEALADD
ncbi:MAG TPA: hypothetical protein VGH54_23490 [Mycobacterium sp.]|jgi:hypothetical protein|uniref:hypothetical protein n=1 Tax=Mycobacterium sp. TaxID=1785 RepID=UPI002F42C8AE